MCGTRILTVNIGHYHPSDFEELDGGFFFGFVKGELDEVVN